MAKHTSLLQPGCAVSAPGARLPGLPAVSWRSPAVRDAVRGACAGDGVHLHAAPRPHRLEHCGRLTYFARLGLKMPCSYLGDGVHLHAAP